MSTKNKIFLPCEDANHVCDKTQYKEASIWEMIKLNIHLIYCQACRKYTKNNTKLTKKMKDSKVVCLDKTDKDTMKEGFKEVLKEYSL